MLLERDFRSTDPGFTLVEVAVSLAILCLIFGAVFSITAETFAFIGDNDTETGVQAEADQALDRMTEVLRKSGWCTIGGVTYPRVLDDGSALEFRVLRDLDGNGYPFAAATGDKEYGPAVYRIAVDGSGNLRILNGSFPVWHLCRHVGEIRFETYLQNPALQMKEIRTTVAVRKETRRGDQLECTLAGSIHMRN